MTDRMPRVNQLIKQELAELLTRGLRTELPAFTTITDVSVTADLRIARVLVSVFGDEDDQEETLAILTEESGRLRHEIGQRVRLKYTPELTFKLDRGYEHADRLDELFDEIHEHPEGE